MRILLLAAVALLGGFDAIATEPAATRPTTIAGGKWLSQGKPVQSRAKGKIANPPQYFPEEPEFPLVREQAYQVDVDGTIYRGALVFTGGRTWIDRLGFLSKTLGK